MKNKLMNPAMPIMLLFIAGCGDPSEYFDESTLLLAEVVATSDSVVFVDKNHNEATIVNVTSADNAAASRVSLPAAPFHAERREGHPDEVLILSAGYTGSKDLTQQPAALTKLRGNGEKVSYELGTNPFDAIISDPEGRFVFLLRRNLNDVLIENMNEVAIVDLDAEPGAANAATFLTLQGIPYYIYFSENFSIDGTLRKLACIASVNAVYLMDLEHLERRPTVVYLTQTNDVAIVPEQVIFDAESPRIYIRSPAVSDIFALKLTPRVADEERNDFSTAIDIIGLSGSPADMSLFHDGNQSRLLVISQRTREASFVEVSTGKTVSVRFPSEIDRAWVFKRTVGDVTTQHALVWEKYSKLFYVLDFAGVEEMLGRNIRYIGNSYEDALELLPVLDGNRLLLLHNGIGMSIIDLDLETIAPFASQQRLDRSYLDESRRQFWVAPFNQSRVAFVNIDDGETDDMLLDHNVYKTVPVFEAGKLVIIHNSDIGHLSVVDVEFPDRDHAFSLKGFFVEDLL